MEETPKEKFSIAVFIYVARVWLITFVIGTFIDIMVAGFDAIALSLLAFMLSLPALLPVYFLARGVFRTNPSDSVRKVYMVAILLLAYFLVSFTGALFFSFIEIMGMVMVFGLPHFIAGLLVVLFLPIPEATRKNIVDIG